MVRESGPVLFFHPKPGLFSWDLLSCFFVLVILAAYIRGLFIPLMDNDSAHHALIALTMDQRGDYVDLYFRGEDYLDKPHFLFWIVAASFHFFGVTPFAYKVPSFLFSVLGAYSTFRLGKKLFDLRTGMVAAAILCTSYAFVLANNDVRMDAILLGSTIFSIWQLVEFVTNRKSWVNLVSGALGMAIAFSTKGAIGLVFPMLAVAFFILQKRQWSALRDFRWLLLACMVFLLLLPEFYCYYLQFDTHPEKVIRGEGDRSGIIYLLVGQSMERYSGTAWGAGSHSDPLFFVHTFLWASLPWSLLALAAFWQTIKWLWKNKFRDSREHPLFLPATCIVVFLIISGSSFRLPHYLNILLPLFSLITAASVVRREKELPSWIVSLQVLTTALMIVAVVILNTIVFPAGHILLIIPALVLLVFYLRLVFARYKSIVTLSLCASAFSYLLLNFNFYPRLLQFQAGSVLANEVKAQNIDPSEVCYAEGFHTANSFDFGLQTILPSRPVEELKERSYIVYTDDNGKNALAQAGIRFHELASAPYFRITKFDWDLLHPERRKRHEKKSHLLRISP